MPRRVGRVSMRDSRPAIRGAANQVTEGVCLERQRTLGARRQLWETGLLPLATRAPVPASGAKSVSQWSPPANVLGRSAEAPGAGASHPEVARSVGSNIEEFGGDDWRKRLFAREGGFAQHDGPSSALRWS